MKDEIPSFYDPNNLLKNIGIKLSDFETIKNGDKDYTILGCGNFGYCEKMKSKINNHFYAIKKLSKVKKKDFKRETQIMSEINNKYCVRFFGYFKDIEKKEKYKEIYKDNEEVKNNINEDVEIYCLVLEYISNGTLESYYLKNIGNIPEDFIIKIFKQLLNCVSYLHDKKIMHRDIKPNNILFDENNDIKITDFGLCALSLKDNQNNINNNTYIIVSYRDGKLFGGKTRCGPIEFASPEVEKKIFYGVEVDIFQLGLTMLVLVSTEYPISFKEISEQKSFREINENYIKNEYNSDLIHLIIKMINKEGSLRPTAEEALYELELIENNKIHPNFEEFKNSIRIINKKYEEKVKNFDNMKNQFYNKNLGRCINHPIINSNNINNNSNSNGNNNENMNQIFESNIQKNNNSFNNNINMNQMNGNNNVNMSQVNGNNNPNNKIYDDALKHLNIRNNLNMNQLNGNFNPNNNIYNKIFENNSNNMNGNINLNNSMFTNNNNINMNQMYGNFNPNNNNFINNNINMNHNMYINNNISMNHNYGYNNHNNNIFINNNINMNPVNNMNNKNISNSVNVNYNRRLSIPNVNFHRSNSSNNLTKVQIYNLFHQFYDSQLINVVFIFNQEIKTVIPSSPDTTVEELLKNYVQKAFMKNNISEYLFIFGYKKLDPIPGMKIKEMMINNDHSTINVYDVNSLLGA